MFGLFELSKILFPKLSDQQLDLILQNDLAAYHDYDIKSWLEVKESDLKTDKVKFCLLKTFYQSQFGYDGVYAEILRSLEKWSDNTLLFKNLSGEDVLFYQRFYTFLGFQNFPFVATSTQLFLLGSFCLPMAIVWGFDIKTQVKESFSRFCQLDILEIDSDTFSVALANNDNVLVRTKEGQTITVKVLVAGFAALHAGSQSIDAYLNKLNLLVEDLPKAKLVLDLYTDLVSNKIWLELDHSLCSHKKIERTEINPEQAYLDILNSEKDLTQWLQDHQAVAAWLKDQNADFMKKLFMLLKSKLNLENKNILEPFLNLVADMHSLGKTDFEVVYFDDASGKIKWNDEYFK